MSEDKKSVKASDAAPSDLSGTMTPNEASRLVFSPYVTEKTFGQIERENKLAFMVSGAASKKQIVQAIKVLYEADADEVNTAITRQGKKAFVTFKTPEGARELATKLGLV